MCSSPFYAELVTYTAYVMMHHTDHQPEGHAVSVYAEICILHRTKDCKETSQALQVFWCQTLMWLR